MSENPILSIPTPPLRKSVRAVVYGVWAWGSVILLSVIAGWAILDSAPKWLLAVSVGWQAFGTYAGFMAKNNVFQR